MRPTTVALVSVGTSAAVGLLVAGPLLYDSLVGLDSSAFPGGERLQSAVMSVMPGATKAVGGMISAFILVFLLGVFAFWGMRRVLRSRGAEAARGARSLEVSVAEEAAEAECDSGNSIVPAPMEVPQRDSRESRSTDGSGGPGPMDTHRPAAHSLHHPHHLSDALPPEQRAQTSNQQPLPQHSSIAQQLLQGPVRNYPNRRRRSYVLKHPRQPWTLQEHNLLLHARTIYGSESLMAPPPAL